MRNLWTTLCSFAAWSSSAASSASKSQGGGNNAWRQGFSGGHAWGVNSLLKSCLWGLTHGLHYNPISKAQFLVCFMEKSRNKDQPLAFVLPACGQIRLISSAGAATRIFCSSGARQILKTLEMEKPWKAHCQTCLSPNLHEARLLHGIFQHVPGQALTLRFEEPQRNSGRVHSFWGHKLLGERKADRIAFIRWS